jgi:hypothetical protein
MPYIGLRNWHIVAWQSQLLFCQGKSEQSQHALAFASAIAECQSK